jgi:hypothetical protein
LLHVEMVQKCKNVSISMLSDVLFQVVFVESLGMLNAVSTYVQGKTCGNGRLAFESCFIISLTVQMA